MIKLRSRIVSFRCSQEEYDSLKTLSQSKGARSISEFTRTVTVQNDPQTNLSDVVERLAEKVQLIAEFLEKHKEPQ